MWSLLFTPNMFTDWSRALLYVLWIYSDEEPNLQSKYPTQLHLQREDVFFKYCCNTSWSHASHARRREVILRVLLLCSQRWFHLLPSPSCRVKGFALELGSTERDFLKLVLFLPRLRTVSESNGILHKQTWAQCSVSLLSCPSLLQCFRCFDISPWLDCDCGEWNSSTHIAAAHRWAFYLFKFVFASLFPPFWKSHIYFVHMETTAGLHPGSGAVITVGYQNISISVFENPTCEIHIMAQH